MKFNYKLQRLCGAYYGHPNSTNALGKGKGANLCYMSSGNTLLSAVSNRVQVLDLHTHTVRTLPVEARSNIRCLVLSPDDALLLTIDAQNYAMLVNVPRGVVLHRFKFKKTVRQVCFSPSGHYIAATHGKHVQVWVTPQANMMRRDVSPMMLHRTYTGQSEDVICLCWSSDSSMLMAGSRDGTVRLWTLHTTHNYEPMTLSGHKTAVVGSYFHYETPLGSKMKVIDSCYTVSEDGVLVTWKCDYGNRENERTSGIQNGGDSLNYFSGVPTAGLGTESFAFPTGKKSQAHQMVEGTWASKTRHYFHQEGAVVTCTSYCNKAELLVVGFSSGLFGLYELPSVSNIHTLSVGSNQAIHACTLNNSGDWLALGCTRLQQLLVWEWRSETYVLKQRGHAYGMRCMAYSPDGVVICTGGEDGKLKLWNATSGFCYTTMEQSHTAPITVVTFANSSVVLSASLDGTVRAHDLHRYRTFKTLTTPTPVQFLSLAVDPAGEIVTAGSTDPFHIYVWNLQTGKLMDILTGHTGPVCELTFPPAGAGTGMLASSSWDGTVQLWDLYKGNVSSERLQHGTDVVCVAFRPDGKELVSGTMGGLLSVWNVETAKLKFEIDGRRDITGGRKMNDRMTFNNNSSSRYFTSVCYSADGSCILAGGNSKFVCIYEVSQQMLLKKFQVTFNRSLDGVLDELNSKNLADGGPVDEEVGSEDEATYQALMLPGAKRGDDGSRKSRVEVLTHQVAFSSTGREWAAISGEGLHIFSLDDDMIFDPISLTESITPAAIKTKLALGDHSTALRIAIHLNELSLVREVLEETPFKSIRHVVRTISREQLERLLQYVGKCMSDSPHVEFYLEWCLQLLQTHGMTFERGDRGPFMRAFRAMYKVIQTKHEDVKMVTRENKYNLAFLEHQSQLVRAKKKKKAIDAAVVDD